MSWIELLRMSGSNLRRRKLRTFLTVLGVVIGTASIVVMVSLGLGMQRSMYKQVEEYGGLTTIKVMSSDSDYGMYGETEEGSSNAGDAPKYISDELIQTLKGLEHVKTVEPVYNMSGLLVKGGYNGYVDILAMTPEGLKDRKIELGKGTLPKADSGQLELVYGNQILTNFSDKNGNGGYWETGELPDIDLINDPMFLILDMDNYYASESGSSFDNMDVGGEGQGSAPKPAKKYVVKGSGIVKGGVNDYNANCYNVFCDLETLKHLLRKEFSGRQIPGQPETRNGKPMKEFYYSYAQLRVDHADNLDTVSTQIKEMGYNIETNAEYIESVKKEMAIVEAVLGGIGAVSLFVAAIGIANTMMMSIYERTKEIGVMKVLGCSLKNIRTMFLMEAGFIGIIGGVIGNVLSILISLAINAVTAQAESMGDVGGSISYIPIWLMLASIGFAVFVGVAAGFFPARRAMRLSPLEAIRNN